MSTGSEAVAAARARRDRLDPWLRAFVATDDGGGQAGSAGSPGSAGGPLDGLPIAVKGVRGTRTPAVRRLLAAGAVPIGTTSVPRGSGHRTWGWTDRGPTRNPWRGDRSPGGSSAGSAAAVAAGIVPLATGSDGAGSVRIPAAWCGVLGYKPTTGLVPGTDPSGLAVPGVLARDPAWLRAWLEAVRSDRRPGAQDRADRGPAHHDTDLPGRRPRTAAWSADLGFAGDELDPDVVTIARAAADRLVRAAGLREVTAALRLSDPAPAWTTLRSPSPSPAAVHAAQMLRRANDRTLHAWFAAADLLLTPTTPAGPHGHDGPGGRMNVALTWAFNLSGHPAVSVPAGFGPDGCPVGLQVVAPTGADDALLALLERCAAQNSSGNPSAASTAIPANNTHR